MIPGYYTINGSNAINKIHLKRSIYRGKPNNNKLRRQKLRAKKLKKSDKTLENEGKLYEKEVFNLN